MRIRVYRWPPLLLLLALLLTACIGPGGLPATRPTYPTAPPPARTPVSPPAAGGKPTVPTPGGPAGQAGGPGPWEDRIYVATSPDGLTWSEGVLLAEKASVPEVIYTSAGVYWAYWVDFTDPAAPGGQRIGVARSTDGTHWEKLGAVTFSGLEARGPAPADPDVMELPDGRLRMYFFRAGTVYSALSSDGVRYTVEEGSRLTAEGIYDPNVIRLPDGRYRMYLNHGDVTSASSDDGLTFALDDGVRVKGGAVPGAIVLPDGAIRLYTCTEGISAYRSANGLDFTLEKRSVIPPPAQGGPVCDPSVTATPTGYLMIYKYRPPAIQAATSPTVARTPPATLTADLSACQGEDLISATPGASEIARHHIYRAVSNDGIIFVGETTPVLQSASVPEAVLSPEGMIWLYFVNGQPGHHGIFLARGGAEGPLEVVDCVKLDGQFDPTAVDPDVVRLANGRYRLFHTSFAYLRQPGSGQKGPMVRQAISDDGIHFTVERVLVPGTDPGAAQLTDGSWLLAIPLGREGIQIYRSADGVQFDLLGQIPEARGMPDLLVLPDGRVRMYVGGGELAAFISDDGGRTWDRESGFRLTVEGPPVPSGGATVVRLPDGRWVLFYIGIER